MTEFHLDREEEIMSHFGYPIGQIIVDSDRQNRFMEHQAKFEAVHDMMMNDVLYLYSVKHPGYIIFYHAERRQEFY